MQSWREYSGYVREFLLYSSIPFRIKRVPGIKFVILTVGRSGSELLVSLLNSHNNICCRGELLGKKVFFPQRYINYYQNLGEKDAFGFKLIIYNFDVQKIQDEFNFVNALYNSGYKIIRLERKNLLRQAISHMYAVYRNKYHHKISQGTQKLEPMQVNITDLRKELVLFEGLRKREALLLEHFSYLDLCYEEDLTDELSQQASVDRISDYLGLTPAKAQTDFIKTTPDFLYNLISNYEDIISFIQTTEYTRYLE